MTTANIHNLPDSILGKCPSIAQPRWRDNLCRFVKMILGIETLKPHYARGPE